jgi:glycosyltransferase involved in cell wall biosynthesis
MESGYDTEIITTNFSHKDKKKRDLRYNHFKKLPYKYTMIEEIGYRKNICLKRFLSHYLFGKKLKNYLKDIDTPDLVYVAVPSLDAAFSASQYSKIHNIPFVLDIQDLWPEAFRMVFNVPVISSLIFLPYYNLANKIYKSADKVIGVSNTYLKRGLSKNKKDRKGLCVYLGTDLERFDEAFRKSEKKKPKNELWIVYIGTLGASYNLKIVIDALEIIKKKGYKKVIFKVLGDGPLIKEFIKYSNYKGVRSDFIGRVHYKEMIGFLKYSDIAINPITKGAAGSIINKHGDYAAAGLPVINTQECIEYRTMIEEYNCGINCDVKSAEDVSRAIMFLIENPDEAKKMGRSSRKLAEELFDRNITYMKIIDLIKETLDQWEDNRFEA